MLNFNRLYGKVRHLVVGVRYGYIHPNWADLLCPVAFKLGCWLRKVGASKLGGCVMRWYDKHVVNSQRYLDFYCG